MHVKQHRTERRGRRAAPPGTVCAVRWIDMLAAIGYVLAAAALAVAGGSVAPLALVPAACAVLYLLLGLSLLRGSYAIGLLQIVVSTVQVVVAFICILVGDGARIFGVMYACFHVPHLALMLTESAKRWFMARRTRRADRALIETF